MPGHTPGLIQRVRRTLMRLALFDGVAAVVSGLDFQPAGRRPGRRVQVGPGADREPAAPATRGQVGQDRVQRGRRQQVFAIHPVRPRGPVEQLGQLDDVELGIDSGCYGTDLGDRHRATRVRPAGSTGLVRSAASS